MFTTQIDLPLEDIRAFCDRHPIKRLALFGSVLREDFTQDSDVDMLVELLPDAAVGYFGLLTMQQELTDLVGRQVDLRTSQELSEQFRQDVIGRAVMVYESE